MCCFPPIDPNCFSDDLIIIYIGQCIVREAVGISALWGEKNVFFLSLSKKRTITVNDNDLKKNVSF